MHSERLFYGKWYRKNLGQLIFFFKVFMAILCPHRENLQKPASDFFWLCVLYTLGLGVLTSKKSFE